MPTQESYPSRWMQLPLLKALSLSGKGAVSLLPAALPPTRDRHGSIVRPIVSSGRRFCAERRRPRPRDNDGSGLGVGHLLTGSRPT
jgi:hypothetical protein